MTRAQWRIVLPAVYAIALVVVALVGNGTAVALVAVVAACCSVSPTP